MKLLSTIKSSSSYLTHPFQHARSKTYRSYINPQNLKEIFNDSPPRIHNHYLPTLGEINFEKYLMLKKGAHNSEIKQTLDNLAHNLHLSDCTALVVSSKFNANSRFNNEENLYNALLCYTSLFQNIGLDIMYAGNYPLHIVVNSLKRETLMGHQDSIMLAGSDRLSLMPFLALVNADSSSLDKTWIKESSLVISELEKSYSKDLFILQKIRFNALLSDKKLFDGHIILKTDENNELYFDQFSTRLQYLPDPESLGDFNITETEALTAIDNLKVLVNSEKGKSYFCLNNAETQFAIINNKLCFHGRFSPDFHKDNSLPSTRNVIALVGSGIGNEVKSRKF